MEHIINIEDKTVKKWHEGYSWKEPMPHLGADFDPKTVIGGQYEWIDGVWHVILHAQYAIEFTDGSIMALTSCGCCDGVQADLVGAAA